MYRAISPAIIMPGVIASQAPLELVEVARFSLGRSTDYSSPNNSVNTISWDIIRHQNGFSPVLSGTITTIDVPAGALYFCGVLSTRSSSPEDGYAGWRIIADSSIKLRNDTHGSDYLTSSVSGCFSVDGVSTIAAQMQTPAASDTVNSSSIYFGGRFFA